MIMINGEKNDVVGKNNRRAMYENRQCKKMKECSCTYHWIVRINETERDDLCSGSFAQRPQVADAARHIQRCQEILQRETKNM